MRKGFEGLYALVRDRLLCKPLSGHILFFVNAQHNRLKLLFCYGSGLWVCAERLETGRFRWSEAADENAKGGARNIEGMAHGFGWNRSRGGTEIPS